MSKKASSRQRLKTTVVANDWDKVLSDAEIMLNEAQDKVRQLKEAIRIFKQRRDNGEPFFGEKPKENMATGQ